MGNRIRILKQLYDVKPTGPDGFVDMEKIGKMKRIVRIKREKKTEKVKSQQRMNDVRNPEEVVFSSARDATKLIAKKIPDGFSENATSFRRPNAVHLGRVMPDDLISISKVSSQEIVFERKEAATDNWISREIPEEPDDIFGESDIQKSTKEILAGFERSKESKKRKLRPRKNIFSDSLSFPIFRFSGSFVATILIFSLIIPCFSYIQKGYETKDLLVESGESVLGELALAKNNLAEGNFEGASANFEESYEILKTANSEVSRLGGDFSEILRFVPGISKVATANYLLSAGESSVLAGKAMSDSLKSLESMKNPLSQEMDVSLTEIFLSLRDGVAKASQNLEEANENIQKANTSDLPAEIQPKFIEVKAKLPGILSSLRSFSDNSSILLDILGYNGPRKFLFLFQNNQEMRATGGFIGSYGVLDVSNGRIKKMFVDDIYNPDGQLKAKVIPPEPIQKMSAVWTMHDANWFPDFPASAEKIAWFYEKTGGPTVDGVISMTPNVIEKMLSVTGPIEMPEYETTVSENDFIEKTQQEVEVEYDKAENKPKKFIADLAPKILDKLLNTKDAKMMLRASNIFNSALQEKHILMYSKNYNTQKTISRQGWSGEILNTKKDYLSVINTNINGYKTDGVIDEKIEHKAQIKEDGSITDEVTITRTHKGGNEKYEWWNKVNGDWMRVYVPEGSELMEASGQTREFVSPPLDYASLQFKKDPKLEEQDQDMIIDEETGTRIYSENHKTVFANWVYVSPGESVTIKYRYKLPFRLSFDELHHPADTFSVLYQKQSGSNGSELKTDILFPENYQLIWKYPDSFENSPGGLKIESRLETDKFVGFAVEKKHDKQN